MFVNNATLNVKLVRPIRIIVKLVLLEEFLYQIAIAITQMNCLMMDPELLLANVIPYPIFYTNLIIIL